ncbi:MAG: thymidylate kinase [Alphaproteobacteria bacterium]|jgi:thymidylate kinase
MHSKNFKELAVIPKYKDLFNALEKFDVGYCIFKSLECLSDDLIGARGDLDILVNEDTDDLKKAMGSAGFTPVTWPCKFSGMWFYISYCAVSKKTAFVHFHDHIPVGNNKQYKWNIAEHFIDNAITDKNFNVKVASPEDEFAGLILRLSLKKTIKRSDTNHLKELSVEALKHNWHNKTIDQLLSLTKVHRPEFFKKIIRTDNLKDTLKNFGKIAHKHFGKNICSSLFFNKKAAISKFVLRVIAFLRRKSGAPQMRKKSCGRLVAFIGVDGAGKSTQVDLILNTNYFQRTGVKRIYFGANEFWIPGLTCFLKVANASKLGSFSRKISILLTILDRRLRLLRALYYKAKGYLVICDRYFYDDLMYCEKVKLSGRKGKKIKFLRFLNNRIGYTPDATIYLRISGEEAYKRKQDYTEAEKKENVKVYDATLLNRKEVHPIDATLSIDIIHAQIAPIILPELQNSSEAK